MVRFILFPLILFTVLGHGQYIPKFDLQGHRGARGLKPENTIPAFLLALDYGVTTVEMDVAITQDGYIIISHEPWMSSEICTTPQGEPIKPEEEKRYNIYKMPYRQVAQFDCGSSGNPRFPMQEKVSQSKPLLTDVIVSIEDHIKSYTKYQVDYNIEIKSSPEGDNVFHPDPEEYADKVYDLLDQYLPMQRVVIQSFDFRVLKYFHKKYPKVRLAALVENRRSVESNLDDLGFTPSIYSPDYKTLTVEKVAYLHKKNIRVIPWTVNEITDMEKMKSWQVDGIITDYPDRAQKLGLGLKVK